MARDDYLPPDLEAKASSARRRQKLAETMLAQSLQPRQGRMAGRIYVAPSPLEGIAQVAQAWAANRAGERADTEIGDIAKEGRQRTADELARIMTMREGTPGTPTPMGEDPNGGMVDPMPTGAVRPDPDKADMAALLSLDPGVRDIGKVLFAGSLKKSEGAEARAARLQERAMTLDAQAANAALNADQRAEAARQAADARRDIAELMARTQAGIAQGNQATQMSIAKLADARWDRPSANVTASNEAKSKIAAFNQAGRVDLAEMEWKKAVDLAERRAKSELLLESERAAAARDLAELKEIGLNNRWGTVSGNAAAQIAGQQTVEAMRGDQKLAAIRAQAEEERATRGQVSADTAARLAQAEQQWKTASGNAQLGAATQLTLQQQNAQAALNQIAARAEEERRTRGEVSADTAARLAQAQREFDGVSGNAALQATTTMRGQDKDERVATRGQDVTANTAANRLALDRAALDQEWDKFITVGAADTFKAGNAADEATRQRAHELEMARVNEESKARDATLNADLREDAARNAREAERELELLKIDWKREKERNAPANAVAVEDAKAAGEARRTLPDLEAKSAEALRLLDELANHPGKKIATGKSALGQTYRIPGTAGYDFANRLEQVQGESFLQAFQTLKGGGQITEREGEKATTAINRMKIGISEPEFDAAAKDLRDVIESALSRARARAGAAASPAQSGWKIEPVR